MTHIQPQYKLWYDAKWYCTSSRAILLCSDPHLHTLSLTCPSATQSLQVLDAKYSLPSNICPWAFQLAFLSACTMVQGPVAQAQLPEWIAYHRILGIEQFYVYVNENMQDPPFHHESVHWIPFQDPFNTPHFAQKAMQNDCIARSRYRSTWVALMDVDEYFQPLGQHLISDILQPFEGKKIGGLQIKNCFFGRHPEADDKHAGSSVLKIDRYVWRAPHAHTSGREKVIVQPIHVVYFSVHTITLGEPMHIMDPTTEIRMNHYKEASNGVWGYYEQQEWSKLVRDDSMRIYVKQVQHELDSMQASVPSK